MSFSSIKISVAISCMLLTFFQIPTLFSEETIGTDSETEVIEEEANQAKIKEGTHSAIHGFFDLSFKNDYITPRGLLVSNTGLTTQMYAGLIIDLYENPCCLLSKTSFIIGTWNDLWSDQEDKKVGSWNELDWFAGFNFIIAKQWILDIEYLEFLSPPGHFSAEQNLQLTLTYDDSWLAWPVTINPYARLFYAISGDSTVIVGQRGNTFYVELGMTPVYSFYPTPCYKALVSVPTWISVGPPAFWNGGTFGLKDKNSHFGVFSTGIKVGLPLSFIPEKFGEWMANVGIQYYYLINDSLLEAQMFTIGAHEKNAERNVVVFSGGLSFAF